jgi:hypothetical protein
MVNRTSFGLATVILALLLVPGCATKPLSESRTNVQVAALSNLLGRLDGAVDGDEAARLAKRAVLQSEALAIEYRAVWPAGLGNYLVNMGLREHGLCYDWANGLYPRLHELGLRTLELHLAVAHMDTKHEHNCIIVTAPGQPLPKGVVLDAWRHSGHLWFGIAANDKYPWQALPPDRIAPELQNLAPH